LICFKKKSIAIYFFNNTIQNKVIVISAGGRLVNLLEQNGVLHIKLPVHKKSPLALLLAMRIASIIKTQKIDIVHASSRVPAWIGFLACKLTGTPFVTSCHGFYSRHLFSYVMGWGKLVMVISKSVEKRMMEDFKVPKEKILTRCDGFLRPFLF